MKTLILNNLKLFSSGLFGALIPELSEIYNELLLFNSVVLYTVQFVLALLAVIICINFKHIRNGLKRSNNNSSSSSNGNISGK